MTRQRPHRGTGVVYFDDIDHVSHVVHPDGSVSFAVPSREWGTYGLEMPEPQPSCVGMRLRWGRMTSLAWAVVKVSWGGGHITGALYFQRTTMRVFDPEKAARALLDAALMGDGKAAKKHGVDRVTLFRWRERMASDPILQHKVSERKAMIDQKWGEELDGAIANAVDFLNRATETASPAEPEAIAAITNSLKVLADIRLTVDVVNARNSAKAGSAGAATRPLAAAKSG
jgi:hypothetical protein